MVDGTGLKHPTRPTQLQLQDISTLHFSWVPSWLLLAVGPTLWARMYQWKFMTQNHPNGTNSMLFSALGTPVGRSMDASTFMEVLSTKCQTFQSTQFQNLSRANFSKTFHCWWLKFLPNNQKVKTTETVEKVNPRKTPISTRLARLKSLNLLIRLTLRCRWTTELVDKWTLPPKISVC